MIVTALIESLIQSYVLVGLITIAVLPRTRSAILASLNERSWQQASRLSFLGYLTSVVAVSAIAWPWMLKSVYLRSTRPLTVHRTPVQGVRVANRPMGR